MAPEQTWLVRADIETTLEERSKTHGDFSEQSAMSQRLKELLRDGDNWHKLSCEQKESLDMIQHKIARILSGNPNHIDSWHDISGYATLIVKKLGR